MYITVILISIILLIVILLSVYSLKIDFSFDSEQLDDFQLTLSWLKPFIKGFIKTDENKLVLTVYLFNKKIPTKNLTSNKPSNFNNLKLIKSIKFVNLTLKTYYGFEDPSLEAIKKLSDTVLNKKIVAYFVDLSKREDFWLDLTSTRLQSLLLNNGPFKNIQIGLEDISLISNLYRDLIDFKLRFTATHTSGVSACAAKLSELIGFVELDVKLMMVAGNFHDIGKLVIPNSILEKPGKLSAYEYAIIRCHTYYTFITLDPIGGLQRIAEWATYHHEKLDGSGYPFHLTKEEIGTGSRIMMVADIFTAISEDRPYRKGMDKNNIYKVIKSQTDKKLLDKRVSDVLFDNYDRIRIQIKEKQARALDFHEKRFLSIVCEINDKH